jgi:hypothetical protein
MFEAPDQRIVSEELWDRVQQRLDQVKAVYGDAGRRARLLRAVAVNSPYLFSGLLKCGTCGANMTIVAGRGPNHLYAHYGRPQNAFRGDSVCGNEPRIRRDDLERHLLEGLQMQVLCQEVVDYTLERFEHELVKALDGLAVRSKRCARERPTLRARCAGWSGPWLKATSRQRLWPRLRDVRPRSSRSPRG